MTFEHLICHDNTDEIKVIKTNQESYTKRCFTDASFLDLNLCISNGTNPTKTYDKRDDFDFDIVNFPFLDGDVPRRTSYGVYIYLNV